MNAMLPPNREQVIEALSAPAGHAHVPVGDRSPAASAQPDAQAVWRTTVPCSKRQMLYVHIPFCISRCLFCGFYQNRSEDGQLEKYTDLLLRELEIMQDYPALKGTFDTVYFGGGTPTDLPAADLQRLIGSIRERIQLTDDVEFTVEGRLFGFDDEKIQACLDAGANRFSFGVQTFNTRIRQAVGRRLPRKQMIERLNRIKQLGGDQLSVVADLIYGLPEQTLAHWLEDIRIVQDEVALDGVDLYRLKMLPGTPLTQKFKQISWTEEELIERQQLAGECLTDCGWNRLSVTHWGRNSLEKNRYNHQAKIGIDTVPVGCGAGGFVGNHSFMQMMPLEKYTEQIHAGLKPGGMIMPRRKNPLKDRVTDQMERCFFVPAEFYVQHDPLIDNWCAAGIWKLDDDEACRLTPLGDYYQPQLTARLIAHLQKA